MSRRPRQPDPHVVVGYVRVSPDERKVGAEEQRQALQAWAERCKVRLVAVHEDVGVRASTPIDARPGFVAALGDVARARAAALVVLRRDRVSAQVVVVEQIERELERHGAKLVSVEGVALDDEDASDALVRHVLAAAAQHQREIISARTKGALAAMRRDGKRVGQVPYGKRLATDCVHVEDDPVEQQIVRRIGEWRAEGLSLREIVVRLNEAGAPARGSRWHLTTVQRLLARSDSLRSAPGEVQGEGRAAVGLDG